ncbi:MAG: Fe-S cluster assembly ATPase SufC [Candidatus Lloydbacteria bacterium]|nr:Fe-S cluster assembly ATPase SufC [Candidatus Lloydbacteria bacterium]
MNLLLKNITASVREKLVVSGVNIEIKPGEIHILMGQNGSGKSSLVNAIMGHPGYMLSLGEMLLGGRNIAGMSPDEKARTGLFLSPQQLPEIHGVTLISFLHKAHQHITGAKMPVLDFYAHVKNIAEKLGFPDSLLKRQVNVGMSGGEKKQSEIIQLAVLKPAFAFLDEIDSGVDKDAIVRIYSAIQTLAKETGTGFLLITHYDAILKYLTPDAVHIMYGGKIVRSGGAELVKEIEEKGYTKLLCEK